MPSVPIPPNVINWDILNEVVSMDEFDPGFSQQLIVQYIEQAETTFRQISEKLNLSTPDLINISSLGHFLKGSSASLGLQRIAWTCERIQNYGKKAGVQADKSHPDSQITGLISEALDLAQCEFKSARAELSKYYNLEL